MKNITLVLSCLFVFQLTIAQKCMETSRYFRIDSATKLTGHAGVYGGGSLVTYTVYLTVKNKHLKYFDSAWAHNNSALVIYAVPKNTSLASMSFTRNNHFRLMIGIPYQAGQNTETVVKRPLNCPQELILRYKARKKFHYIVCSKFTELPTINLP